MRIVNNQRNNSTSISKEDNGKAIAPKVYDDESHDTEEVYEDCVETHSSHGAFPDLTNTVDTEEVTTHAPGKHLVLSYASRGATKKFPQLLLMKPFVRIYMRS